LCLAGSLREPRNIIHEIHFCKIIVLIDALFQRSYVALELRLNWTYRIASFLLRPLMPSACSVWRLVARAIVAWVDSIALEVGNFEIDAPELYNVTHSDHLLLVVGEKVLQHLINRALLTDNEPHGPAKIYIILFVLVRLALRLRLLVDMFIDAVALFGRALAEVVLVEEGLVVGPETPILVLHHEPQNNLILPFQFQLVLYDWRACDLDALAHHQPVRWLRFRLNIIVMPQIFEHEFLVVVGLLFIDVEVCAVEVKEAVR